MTLLTLGQVVTAVESNAEFVGFVQHSEIRRNLYALGGVPRWVVEYLLELKKCMQPSDVKLKVIQRCFRKIWTKYVRTYSNSIETHQLVRLAAFAVSGQQVDEDDQFDEQFKWSGLRDSSLCLLIPSAVGDRDVCDIRVPYSLLHSIGLRPNAMISVAEKSFAAALTDMREMVDDKMFDLEPWQSWEIFGACFYAVRINALLVLGRSTVTLRELLPGALMTDETLNISVELVLSKVFRCAGKYGRSTPQHISQKRLKAEQVDWTSSGCIVVNDDNGPGVDICFALKEAGAENLVVFVDQRKRVSGKFQPSQATKYLDMMLECPSFLENSGARLVRGVMNCVATSNLQVDHVPPNCFLLSRDETERYHGTLADHPACTPVVPINAANKTALKSILEGHWKDVDEAAEAILGKRMEPSGGFDDCEAMRSFLESKKLRVEINELLADWVS